MDKEFGKTHLYCGDGKGKTTAAIGLGVRATGFGKKVFMLQFLKSNQCSEHVAIANIKNFSCKTVVESVKFVFQMTDEEKFDLKAKNEKAFADVVFLASENKFDMLILDEVVATLNLGLLDKQSLFSFLKSKPQNLEVVLTGQCPCEELIELCDYVSEMKKIKHPFDKGLPARKGIEK